MKRHEQPILKKVSMNHMDQTTDLERTTTYDRYFDLTYRRTSTSSNQSQRRNSFVTFENNDSLSIKQIKTISDPPLTMNELQIRVWKTLTKCTQSQLESCYLIDIIVLVNDTEFEFKFDISPLSCFMTVKELCSQIHLIYQETKNQQLQDPHLYILVGVIKTQKLDGDMRIFELLNILLNGKKTLILQNSHHL